MPNEFSRTALVLGKEKIEKLSRKKVAIFGVGGVGGYVVEALARSGVGSFALFDNDTVSLTNINRQIIALHSTIGKYKVDVAKERILDINPKAEVETHKAFYLPENADEYDLTQYDYVVDAIDTVTAKITLVEHALKAGTPIVSSMGTGNKTNPTRLRVSDIAKTSVCPLARVMRRELKVRGIHHLDVLWSDEIPIKPGISDEVTNKRQVPGSTAFVPSVGGLVIAAYVIGRL